MGIAEKADQMLNISKTLPQDWSLHENDVHIWQAELDLPTPEKDSLALLLSPQESARASRFRFEKDRRRFIAAHGILRCMLGHYLGAEPDDVMFCHGPAGKPELAAPHADRGICFNLSHSHGVGLYGFTRGRQIGVDIERIQKIPEMGKIAGNYFSPMENEALNRLPAGKKIQAFFRVWTVKEAYIKAIGRGLSVPLDSFDVCVDPDKPARLIAVRGDAMEASRWSVEALKPDGETAGTVVVRGRGLRVFCGEWPRW